MRASEVPLGAAVSRRAAGAGRANLAAGECGVKDQVSRTQPDRTAARLSAQPDRGGR